MNRRYAFYLLGSIAALVIFVTTSYGALFFASVLGAAALGASVIAWTGLISVSDRFAHHAVRTWNAVVPANFASTKLRL